jgi:hypothetical protein
MGSVVASPTGCCGSNDSLCFVRGVHGDSYSFFRLARRLAQPSLPTESVAVTGSSKYVIVMHPPSQHLALQRQQDIVKGCSTSRIIMCNQQQLPTSTRYQ